MKNKLLKPTHIVCHKCNDLGVTYNYCGMGLLEVFPCTNCTFGEMLIPKIGKRKVLNELKYEYTKLKRTLLKQFEELPES